MFIDTIKNNTDSSNLSVRQCKDWWEKKVSDNYFTAYSWGLSAPDLYARVPLNDDSYILEIGFGYGRQISQFLKISDNVFGVDISDAAVDIAKKYCQKAFLQSYDGINIPIRDNTMDFITSVFVLQHMSKKSAESLLVECIRVLKPNGIFLHEFLGGHGIAGIGKEHYSGGVEGMYNNGYTVEEIKLMCNRLNFKLEWIEEVKIYDEVTNIWLSVKK